MHTDFSSTEVIVMVVVRADPWEDLKF